MHMPWNWCTRLVNSPECFPYGKPLYTIYKFPQIPAFSCCCCMILFSIVKHNMNSPCIKGNLKLIQWYMSFCTMLFIINMSACWWMALPVTVTLTWPFAADGWPCLSLWHSPDHLQSHSTSTTVGKTSHLHHTQPLPLSVNVHRFHIGWQHTSLPLSTHSGGGHLLHWDHIPTYDKVTD